jgi:hypothetical protein
MEIFLGFIFGIVASAVAAVVYERATQPKLAAFPDEDGPRQQGQAGSNPRHEFFHLVVRNLKPIWPIPGRKPAWSTTATLQVLKPDGTPHLPDTIFVRWTSRPEPLLPGVAGNALVNMFDMAGLVAARKIDVHGHQDERLSVVVKYEGKADCHIFTNESYLFPNWENPAWALPVGEYRLRLTLLYERGRHQQDFKLTNSGSSRDDVRITPFAATDATEHRSPELPAATKSVDAHGQGEAKPRVKERA